MLKTFVGVSFGSSLVKVRNDRLKQPQCFVLKAAFNAHIVVIAGKHLKGVGLSVYCSPASALVRTTMMHLFSMPGIHVETHDVAKSKSVLLQNAAY